MDETMLKLKILARAEITLARANLRRMAIRTSLAVVRDWAGPPDRRDAQLRSL